MVSALAVYAVVPEECMWPCGQNFRRSTAFQVIPQYHLHSQCVEISQAMLHGPAMEPGNLIRRLPVRGVLISFWLLDLSSSVYLGFDTSLYSYCHSPPSRTLNPSRIHRDVFCLIYMWFLVDGPEWASEPQCNSSIMLLWHVNLTTGQVFSRAADICRNFWWVPRALHLHCFLVAFAVLETAS